jgi:hypothetical protein
MSKRILIFLCVSGFTGLNLPRCKSAPTPRETVQAVSDVDDLAAYLDGTDAPATVKAAGRQKAAAVKKVLERQGEALTTQAATIDGLQKYRWLVFGFVSLLACVAGFFAVRFFFFR